jgi:hypothetical protein
MLFFLAFIFCSVPLVFWCFGFVDVRHYLPVGSLEAGSRGKTISLVAV